MSSSSPVPGDTHSPRVDYFYDEAIGNFHYGEGHPMRPHRVRLTHHLVVNYGLYKHMNIFRPRPASRADLTAFHSDDYIRFLSDVTPDSLADLNPGIIERYNMGEDCPVFDGLYEYCCTYTGGSLAGAARLNQGCADIVINWAGGLHHAKRGEASGFCYTNDIVLAILELMKTFSRVLYIDIDIHHGDGVEEAFYLTDRVLTLSFHQSGHNFFPRTGFGNDTGAKRGKGYAINFPLSAGMDDEAYESVYRPVIAKIMEHYQPGVVVMCCGADSLSGDRVGCWNLSFRGHAGVLEYVKTFNLPMLVLGGGGYTIRNVARCWCFETSRLLGQQIPDALPWHEYMDYYAPEYRLHVPISNMENENTREALEKTKAKVLEQIAALESTPSALQLMTSQPGARRAPDTCFACDSDEDDDFPNTRPHRAKRSHLAEYFDEDDAEGDTMDTERLGLKDFLDCGHAFGSCDCDD